MSVNNVLNNISFNSEVILILLSKACLANNGTTINWDLLPLVEINQFLIFLRNTISLIILFIVNIDMLVCYGTKRNLFIAWMEFLSICLQIQCHQRISMKEFSKPRQRLKMLLKYLNKNHKFILEQWNKMQDQPKIKPKKTSMNSFLKLSLSNGLRTLWESLERKTKIQMMYDIQILKCNFITINKNK